MAFRRDGSRYNLCDSPFYRLKARRRLAALLEVSLQDIQALSSRDDLYERGWKHKKEKNLWLKEMPSPEIASDYRAIDIPDPKLKKIQSRIATLLGRITPPDWLFSPVKGRSYVDNAAVHAGSRAFWLLDIADYFPSCTASSVAHFFHKKLECSPDVTAILVHITTWMKCLPQGSPCSPILAYFSNLDMWKSIEQLVVDGGLKHSVYADDITISGPIIPKEIIWNIKRVVHRHGLKIKAEKEVSLIDSPAQITGVIVSGDSLKLPNRQLKRLFELRSERQRAKSDRIRKLLDVQISGRVSQKRQIEIPRIKVEIKEEDVASIKSFAQPFPPVPFD